MRSTPIFLAEGYLDHFGLENLRTLTIIEPEGCHDIVLCDSRDNCGEFQAWSINPTGQTEPWHIPEHRMCDVWEANVTETWANTEEFVDQNGEEFTLDLVRKVSRSRLLCGQVWQKRIEILEGTQRLWMGCLYRKNEIIQ